MGVQHCTDVDINIVAGDALAKADLEYLSVSLEDLKRRLYELFGIVLEVDPSFTILKEKEIAARLAHPDEELRGAASRFYKSNEKSISVIRDEPRIREALFSRVRAEPDASIFDNFLGFKGKKPSYAKLRLLTEKLPIAAEGGEKVLASAVIGRCPSRPTAAARFRRAISSRPRPVFSMKYFVNRVYDYVGAMRCQGYSLEEIGFDEPEAALGADPTTDFSRTRTS